MSKVARHPRHPAVVNMGLEEISQRYTVRFADIKPDWSVFGDSNFDGYRRAQFRYIGETLGKPEVRHIPAGATRLSVMYVPPGEGNAPHTHPVEEVFFILKGNVTVFFEEDTQGKLRERSFFNPIFKEAHEGHEVRERGWFNFFSYLRALRITIVKNLRGLRK